MLCCCRRHVNINYLFLINYFRELAGSSVSRSMRVPVPDQQSALALLLELAVQRGTLRHILSTLLLLLNLWNGGHHDRDNRLSAGLTAAPLIPLLRRLHDITPSKKIVDTPRWDDVSYSISFVLVIVFVQTWDFFL